MDEDGQIPGTSFCAGSKLDGNAVKVALRIRPQIPREKLDGSRVCTRVTPNEPQVLLGSDRAFTFDHVFDLPTEQSSVYEKCALNLVEGTFDGYNATVFAYGQTGSGKTYTMGTGFDLTLSADEKGIIPRAVEHLFQGIQRRKEKSVEEGQSQPEFRIQVQFTELYNEEIIDLLEPNLGDSGIKKGHIRIHEDSQGNIYMDGATQLHVQSTEETLKALKNGALSRTTASTNMNTTSSRSHAIFTIMVRQQRVSKFESNPSRAADSSPDSGMEGSGDAGLPEFESLTAKFHFVDLAGSERLKRTGATGDRAKEGISINCGLLALGNVISALGDPTKRALHVPYRDSKLTRLLQDSLGGNSRTLMIACISPSDCDFVETLNTLKYANRAKNIKNKVVVNQDKTSRIIGDLRAEIQKLQLELIDYKQGKRLVSADGTETVSDMFHENVMLETEVNNLRTRIKALQTTIDDLKMRNAQLLSEREIQKISLSDSAGGDGNSEDVIGSAIRRYIEEIEELRSSICEKDAEAQLLRRQLGRFKAAGANQLSTMNSPIASDLTSEIHATASLCDLSTMMRSATSELTLTEESVNGSILDEARADIERLKSKTSQANRKIKSKEKRREAENGATSDYATDQNEQEDQKSPSLTPNGEPSTNEVLGLSESGSSSDMNDGESEGEETEDESDTEEELEEEKYRRDLAELQTEISIRERLVEELERSQRNMAIMQKQYDMKVRDLQSRIAETETERDKILTEMESKSVEKVEKEKVIKIRQDYEEKLNTMKNQLRQCKSVEKEHQRATRENESARRNLQRLQTELGDLKKAKVQLMQRIKEESKKSQALEQKRSKELSVLQKEGRQKDHRIKTLEAKQELQETILKRKQEELAQFRKANRAALNQQRSVAATRATAAASRMQTQNGQVQGPPSRFQRRPIFGSTPLRGAVHQHVAIRRGPFSPKVAKQKWTNIEKTISGLVNKKQTIAQMEQDLDRFLMRREDLSKQRTALATKLEENPMREDRAELKDELESVQANLDYLQEAIADSQRAIVQMEDSKDDGDEESELKKIADVTNLSEAKYLLDRLVHLSVSQCFQAAIRESELKETEARVRQLQKDSSMKANLLSYAMDMNPELFELDGITNQMTSSGDSGHSIKTARTPSPDSLGHFQRSHSFMEKARRRTATTEELLYPLENPLVRSQTLETVPETNGGSRTRETSPERLTELTEGRQELVEKVTVKEPPTWKREPPVPPPKPKAATPEILRRKLETVAEQEQRRESQQTLTEGAESDRDERVKWRLKQVPEWSENPPQGYGFRRTLSSKENGVLHSSASSSRSLRGDWRGSLRRPASSASLQGTDLRRDGETNGADFSRNSRLRSTVASTSNIMTKSTGHTENYPLACSAALPSDNQILSASARGRLSLSETPPVSPRPQRRLVADSRNVFTRLIQNGASGDSGRERRPRKKGVINAYVSKPGARTNEYPLNCTHVVQNASETAVLSVAVCGTTMVTGAKDRLAKVWDLVKGEEVSRLGAHPNNVTCVKIRNNLVFTVSNANVRVWDMRSNACVKTLSSSGLTTDGEANQSTPSRTNTLPSTEQMINALELGPRGDYLLTAAGTQVRIWDAQRFTCTGKLVKATQSPSSEVTCLAIMQSPNNKGDYVLTGSRDHYTKAYQLPKQRWLSAGLECQILLDPPHYDGVTCLMPVRTDAIMSDKFWLFSASRDQNLMKWELPTGRRLHQEVKAHGNWIMDMKNLPAPFGRVLVSCCREGLLKLWDVDSCSNLGEIKAHNDPIYSLAISGESIFTASGDGCVGVWKPNANRLFLEPETTI